MLAFAWFPKTWVGKLLTSIFQLLSLPSRMFYLQIYDYYFNAFDVVLSAYLYRYFRFQGSGTDNYGDPHSAAHTGTSESCTALHNGALTLEEQMDE
jgi:hypothetical protein